MNEIEIKEEGEKITYSEETKFDENQLIEKYRNEMMASRVQESMVAQTPQILSGMKVHIEMSKIALDMNESKQARLKKVFEDLEINVTKRIEKIKTKYNEDDLIRMAKDVLSTSKTELVKEGDGYIMKTEVSQSVEDLIIEFMGLQNAKPQLIEKLLEQEKSVGAKQEQAERANNVMLQIKDRMKIISDFFSKKGKDINVLLDQTAQTRTKHEAQTLPEAQNE